MTMASEQIPVSAMRTKNSDVKLQVSKTKLCKFHAMKQCRYGDQCSFAHGSEDLEQIPDLRKTSICKEWRQGTCRLQSIDCPFAHGRSELRRTNVNMHKANVFRGASLFDNIKPGLDGLGNNNLFDNTNFEANGFGNHNLFGNMKPDHDMSDNTMLEVDQFEASDAISTSSDDESIDEEPIKVNTMDSLTSISTRSSFSMSINREPIKMTMPSSLRCYDGPSVMLYNLPFKYSKKMLTSEIEDLGFGIPRDIVHIHLPIAFDTHTNYGHCSIVFTGTPALNAFKNVFQGRVMRHFTSERKVVMVVCKSPPGLDLNSPPGFDVSSPPGLNVNSPPGLDVSSPPGLGVSSPPGLGMEVTRLSEVQGDRFVLGQQAECKPCPGCGHMNTMIGHRFCPWCGQPRTIHRF